MQTADVTLALAGDTGNTIRKYGVTPSEVAVLRLIHGDDSVTEIAVHEAEIDVKDRAERARLAEAYGAQDGETFRSRAVDVLFPGAAARMFSEFDELELDESLFMSRPVVEKAPKRTNKKAAAKAAEPEAGDDLPDDGIEDMPDVMG